MPSNTNPVHMKNGDNYSGYNFIMPSDTKDCVTTFTSSDNDATTEKTLDGFTSVATMASGESHASLFQKISKMFLNIRKLWNTVGSTAIDTAYGTTITAQMANLKSYNTYSTSETWTGKYWIDGKKIYAKTYNFSQIILNSTGGWVNVIQDSTISLDTLIDYTSRIKHDSVTGYEACVHKFANFAYDKSTKYFKAFFSASYSVYVNTLTVEFTKTTD